MNNRSSNHQCINHERRGTKLESQQVAALSAYEGRESLDHQRYQQVDPQSYNGAANATERAEHATATRTGDSIQLTGVHQSNHS